MIMYNYFSATCNERERIYLGDLISNESFDHGVSGKIYSCGANQLLFENFKYDGLAPDAVFWVGAEGNEPKNQ